MDKLAYKIKSFSPSFFRLLATAAGIITITRYGNTVKTVLKQSGRFEAHENLLIRPLATEDANLLATFFVETPDEELLYFKPHGFSEGELVQILRTNSFMNYGMFIDGKLEGYGLLKISPTGTAYMGRIVSPIWRGHRLGGLWAQFLYWQASLAGLTTRATIKQDNIASIKSHQSIGKYREIGKLANNHIMIEYPSTPVQKPQFQLKRRS